MRNFFEERLRATLSDSAFPAEELEDSESMVPALVRRILRSKKELVAASQKIARRLFVVQTGVNSPGLLAVARGSLGDVPAVALVKLEKEHGVRVRPDEVNGLATLSVEHIRDLMLTEKTRVFKTGLFSGNDAESLVVCDYQRQSAHTVAGFFLRDFLGCALKGRSDVQTLSFMEAVESFINKSVESSEDASSYYLALLAELNSQRRTVTPSSFASTHLKQRHRKKFLAALSESQAPTKRFIKDVALVQGRLKHVRYDVDTGAAVIAPPESIGKTVRLVEMEDGRTQIRVDGQLHRIRGKGR